MAQILIDQLSFHYDDPWVQVFDKVELTLDTSWRTALVGANGKGKTTLLQLLTRTVEPSGGRIVCQGACSYFPYQPSQPQRPTFDVIKDAIAPFAAWEREMATLTEKGDSESLERYSELLERFQKLDGYGIEARIEREFASLGMAPELLQRPYDTLSGGEQTRAQLVTLFSRSDRFPLIDEPTNHLDMQGRAVLGEYLAGKPGFILVSHDRHFLELCSDHVVSLNRSDIRLHRGGFADWERQVALETAHEKRRQDNLKREIRSLQRAAQERRRWSHAKEKEKRGAADKGRIGHLAAKQMKRALGIERRAQDKVSEKKTLLKNVEKEHQLKLDAASAGSKTVVNASGLTIGFEKTALVSELSFSLERGDRVAIMGPNGCGKTTFLRTVAGELKPLAGHLSFPAHLDRAQATQTPRWRDGLLRDHLNQASIDETQFRNIMGCFGLLGDVFDRPLETFSQGQRKKVDLCRSFLAPAHLLIWDEPLNYIDLSSRAMIEEVILEHQPTLLFVEHDRRFVERVATAVLELGP